MNSFGSYPIGYAIGIMILPISVGWVQQDPLMANIFITLTYAIVSFIRVYFLRRIFVRLGVDDNFLKLGLAVYHKLHTKLKNINLRFPSIDSLRNDFAKEMKL